MNPTDTKKKRRPALKTAKEIKVQIALGTLETDYILKALRSKKTLGDIIEMLDKIECGGTEDWRNNEKRELISKHPNTPASVLVSIFQRREFMEYPNSIGYADASILLHPSLPAKLLLEVFNKIAYDSQFHGSAEHSYLFKAIENPNFPADLLERLAKHKNRAVLYYVAKHPNTPPKMLELLSTDKTRPHYRSAYWYPQEQVAANLSTPPYVLETLSTAQRIPVRNRVASNPKTPIDVLKAMTTDDKSRKVRAVALYTLFKLGKITFTDK